MEFRHPSTDEINGLAEQFPREAAALLEGSGLELQLTELFRIPAQPFDPSGIGLVRAAPERLGYSTREIVSGAGHDAYHAAARMPAVMLFIPCQGGISHHPSESISREWAEKGLRVLADAVIETANAKD